MVYGEGVSELKTLHNGNNQFTARMFSEVIKENPNKSVVLSAFSVITPLSQLAGASEGPTHDELLDAIGFPDDKTTHAIFGLIDEKFNSIQGIELKKASKLYIPLGYEVHDTFAALSRDVYHAEIANIKFDDNFNSAKEINTWVENQTNHRIKDLIDASSITPDTRSILINALYFKGPWKYPFEKYTTKTSNFYVNKRTTTQVPMMYNKQTYKYKISKRLKSQILELPYAGDQSSFIIVLPNKVEGLEKVIKKLEDPNILDAKTSKMMDVEVQAFIPKFKIETTTNLKDVLIKMNVTKIFDENANLGKLLKTDEKLFVSNAVQKAFIDVNEDGVEAAAANVLFMRQSAFYKRPTFNFIADHPFAFFLKVKGEILFNGLFYGT